jgi:hypothetical protein
MEQLLTHDDYKKILDYYDIPMPRTRMKMKSTAESILANKLCRCIKKVKKIRKDKSERIPTGICRDSVIHRKKLDIYQFQCEKKPSLKNFKGKTYKIRRRAKFSKTRKNKKK